jgi:hypothetical protein
MGPTYFDTFIEVAEDCPTPRAEVPQDKADRKTKAVVEYELIANHPYTHTGEDIAFLAHALYTGIPKSKWPEERAKFFKKGQPCLRASALGKRYGWGTHHDSEGKVALVAVESKDYRRLATDPGLKHTRAMRTKRAR